MTTDRELLDDLVAALRPLMDPDICSPYSSAWEIDTHHIKDDGQTFHARIKALIDEYDGRDAPG